MNCPIHDCTGDLVELDGEYLCNECRRVFEFDEGMAE